ncbi:tRNA (guanosine(46)-N7)-methyltransferase TrmB [Nibricoccus sp. IMCC34717]|uniref:tRNA (guanosine(46)-N7)-methyltransferase TrmB n=1 Tax=Nibricoccus sp. IMCC34717 TaxID=3034021 RepID=UPI00384ECE6D
MLNPARTAEYLQRRDARCLALREDLAKRLGGAGECTLEIGCGHGHFLTAYAEAHPDELCVGIDIILDRIERAERKRTRAGLEQLQIIRAEALEFLDALPEGVRWDRIFILFPDPWPKRRHHKNRLLQPDFLTRLAATAAPGAQLCFRTDHEGYFADALATVRDHPLWRLAPDAAWPFERPTVFQERAAAYQSWIACRNSETSSV